jgi:tol-pal system protein YbgF
MKIKHLTIARRRGVWLLVFVCGFFAVSANAGLFDDEEARKAILDLRQRVEAVRQELDQKLAEQLKRSAESSAQENAQVRRSLLDLQNLIEAQRADNAKLRGQFEQLARDLSETQRQVADLQRQQKDATVAVEDRLRKFEPVKVSQDGRDFVAEPSEKRDFEAALAIFRKGDFAVAQGSFVEFLKRYPQSGYNPSALFWLGNAQYATRDYKEAVINFRSLLSLAPDHIRAPEAVLSIANCQIELKDNKSAKKTLEDLVKAYPQSEAAVAAKDRLARLK